MIELTITTFANIAFDDALGLEGMAPEAMFRGDGVNLGETRTYRMTTSTWDRVRPRLKALETRRVPAVDDAGERVLGATMPAITWSITPTPARNPRIYQIEETAPVTLVSNGTLTVRGVGLLNGTNAGFDVFAQDGTVNPGFTGVRRFNKGVKILRFTAVDVGPIGNRIGIRILPASGSGSVLTEMFDDGDLKITITPAAAGLTASDVATLVNGSTAAAFITATALVGGAKVPPSQLGLVGVPTAPQVTLPTHQPMYDGDGGGIARLDILVAGHNPANRLRVTALKGGNGANRLVLVLKMNQGSNSVSVSDNRIVVNRTGSTETLTNLVSAINGNASAAALVNAQAIGTGSLGDNLKFLYGGAGPDFSATIGGAPASITSHNDTTMVVTVTSSALVAAGVSDMEHTMVQIMAGTTVLQGEVRPGSYPTSVTARIRAQANVTLATPGATMDGVSMAVGDRFWTDSQTTSTEDGLYIWLGASVAAVRAPQIPVGARVSGLLVSIVGGTDAGKLQQVTNAPGADIVGTSNLATAAI